MEPSTYLFLSFLIPNLVVGLYYGRGVKTFRAYAVGDGKMHPWLLAATIVATWATASGFVGYLYDSFDQGIYKMSYPIVAGLTLLLVGFFALRMGEFYGTTSIAGAMGLLYGKKVAWITSITAFMCCVGYLAGQFRILSSVVAAILGINPTVTLLTLSTLVVLYTVFGGIRAVVFTDVLQFAIMGLGLPVVIYFLYVYLGEQVSKISYVPDGKHFGIKDVSKVIQGVSISEYIRLPFIGFIPPLFQRCLANRDMLQIRKAYRRAAIGYVYILILVVLFGRMLAIDPAGLDKRYLVENAIKKYPYLGFKTLLAFVVIAMALSSIDSYINTSAILLCELSNKKSLLVGRIFGVLTGVLSVGIVFLAKSKGLMELIYTSSLFYVPVVVPVLILALLGFRSSGRTAFLAMVTTALSSAVFRVIYDSSLIGTVAGILTNFMLMFGLHYLLGEPGGWVGIQDKAPLIAHAQLRRRRRAARRAAWRTFNLKRYLINNLPKKEGHYILFGLYVLTFVFGSIFFLPRSMMQAEQFPWLLGSFLLVNLVPLTYPILPEEVKRTQLIAPIWAFGVGYILFYISGLLLLLGGFHMVHVALLIVNLTLGMLLLRRKLMTAWLVLGGLMAVLTCHGMGHDIFLTKAETTWRQLGYALFVTLAGLWAVYANKQQKRQLEQRHLTLGSLQRTTEEALTALRWSPNHFAQQLEATHLAGVESAYQMSKARSGEQDELTQQIGQSAQYLAKTLQLIQDQTRIQERPCLLWKFLNQLYRRHPELDEAGLILYNRSQTNTIRWDADKMHQLLYKTYRYLKPYHPDVQYSYLYVQHTTLKYPGKAAPMEALAFTFTFTPGQKPGVAACYTHTERVDDPYLMGNRQLREMNALADKHYGYLDLTQVPARALIVLPVRLDKIRPKMIEDQPAPNQVMQNNLLREAKIAEANFWQAVTAKDHYNISEIERAVHFIKAAHQHQTRKDKTPYYTHPLIVAKYVSSYDPRPHMLIAALLHDIVEDTHVTLEEINIRFGPEVAQLVKLLSNTKLNTFKKYKDTDKKAHTARMAENLDAILIKTCDRLHNLETLNAMPRHKQQAKAKETLAHYLPVIKAAGFTELAQRLEEMAKKFL